jgi:hypothetical protein
VPFCRLITVCRRSTTEIRGIVVARSWRLPVCSDLGYREGILRVLPLTHAPGAHFLHDALTERQATRKRGQT